MFLGVALMTIPETRVIAAATAGWAYLLSCLLVPSHGNAPSSLWLRQWLLCVSGLVGVLCAIGTVIGARMAEDSACGALEAYLAAQDRQFRSGDLLIVAEARAPHEVICGGDRLAFHRGLRDTAVMILTMPGTGAAFSRRDEHTLVVRAVDRPLFSDPMHRLTMGRDWPARAGDEIHLRGVAAKTTLVDRDRRVLEFEVRFDAPLTSPHIHYYPPQLAEVALGRRSGWDARGDPSPASACSAGG